MWSLVYAVFLKGMLFIVWSFTGAALAARFITGPDITKTALAPIESPIALLNPNLLFGFALFRNSFELV